MSRYEAIRQGLLEAIAYERGELEARVHQITVSEVSAFTPEEIKTIRKSANMTQALFAACMGVTKKSIEAWEGGRSVPDGAARRTLGLVQKNPMYFDDMKIIIR